MWGRYRVEEGKTYDQCVYTTNGDYPIGWYWVCDSGSSTVKGFPQILYGQNPFSLIQTTEELPINLALVKNLYVTTLVDLKGLGNYNLSFDLWISSTDKLVGSGSLTHEIMVWLYQTMPLDTSGYVGDFTIDSHIYSLYRKPKTENGRWFIMFVAKDLKFYPETIDLNLASFLNLLYDMKFLNDRLYLDCVELGTEMWGGSGSCKIYKYEIKLDKAVVL
jgi:hypothetical protein